MCLGVFVTVVYPLSVGGPAARILAGSAHAEETTTTRLAVRRESYQRQTRTEKEIQDDIDSARHGMVGWGVAAGVAAGSLLVVTPVGMVVMGAALIGSAIQFGRAWRAKSNAEEELRHRPKRSGPAP